VPAAEGSGSIDPVLAVVPARAGSKGIAGKNLRPLSGLSLLGHAIRCAQRVGRIARLLVSTDGEEIAQAARALGAEAPFLRPAHLAGDDAPTMPVLQHALDWAQRAEGRRYGSVLLLEPTSPGRLPEDVERALARLDTQPDADGVVACSQPHFNPFYVGVLERDGYLVPALPRPRALTRRQDAPPFLRINGLLYLWRAEFVARAPADWTSGRHVALQVPESRALSIDDEHELQVAQALLAQGLWRLPWLAPREVAA
jgi:CMP-N,N'-diacetyllegionaminic acid synthase